MRMQFLSGLVIGLAAAGVVAAVAEDARVVADVDGRAIVVADLVTRISTDRQRAVSDGRLDAFTSGAKARALDSLVETKLLSIVAREERLQERPDIKRQLENAADDLLASRMREEIVQRKPPSDVAVREYYAAHQSDFQTVLRLRARHIVVKTEAEAVSLLGRLKRNADFAQLARENNVDNTRTTGGELGWVSRGVMVPEFEAALFVLKIGEISPVVSTPYGFHIAQVEDVQTPRPAALDVVADDIRAKLAAEAVAAVRSDAEKRHPVKINSEILKAVP